MVLINPSPHKYLAYLNLENNGLKKTIFSNSIPANQWVQIDKFNLTALDKWPALHIKLLPILDDFKKDSQVISKSLKFKAKSFTRPTIKLPLVNKKGYLFELSSEEKDLDVIALNQELNSTNDEPTMSRKRPASKIDLHIEELVNSPESISNSRKLQIQLEVFEQNLNQAISSGMDEITFIHGIGNGILRKEIQKRLSEIKNIKYFKDAQKDPWGYGATLVRIS